MKVLIADDELNVCHLIAHLIKWEELGMELVSFAHDGEVAIAKIHELRPDIVITDIRMPGFNGLELIQKVKESLPETTFIIVSGFREFEYAQEALRQGVSNFLIKPVDQKELNHTLEKIRQRSEEKNEQLKRNRKLNQIERENVIRSRKELMMKIVNSQIQLPNLKDLNIVYHYKFQAGCFRLAILKLDNLPENLVRSHHFRDKVGHVLEEHLEATCYDYAYIFHEKQYFIILNYKEDVKIEKNLKHIVKELLQDQDIFQTYSVTIGLGRPDSDVAGLADLEGATWSLSQRLVTKSNRVIFEMPYQIEEVNLQDFSKKFYRHFEAGDHSSLLAQVEEKITEFLNGENVAGLEIIQLSKSIYSIFLDGLKRFDTHRFEYYLSLEGFLEEIDNLSTAGQILSHLKDVISKSFQEMLKHKEETDSKPISLAKRYIAKNFSSPLTLEKVSEEAGFSPAYFSTMFKAKTGESFTDYLFKQRMEEAKRQLRDTDLPVGEICINVGYLDIKYFNKGFKKHAGITPKAYRNLYS